MVRRKRCDVNAGQNVSEKRFYIEWNVGTVPSVKAVSQHTNKNNVPYCANVADSLKFNGQVR